MYRSLAVSAFFIKKGLQDSKPVTPMKLQKLLYFAHGWHLATYGSPLLIEEFEAWKFGPVLPNVYYHFKNNGPFPIKEIPMGISFEAIYEGVNKFLDVIWEVYAPYSAKELSNITHLKGTPWDNVFRPDVNNIPIPNAEIENYFQALKAQNNESPNIPS